MGPATFTLGLTGRIKVHRVSCWDTRSPGHWCKGGSRCCSTWGRLRVPLVGCSDFTQVSLGGVNVDQQLDQLWEVPRDRRLCGKGVKEFLVEPEQQAVDLGLVTIVAVGHIAPRNELNWFFANGMGQYFRSRMAINMDDTSNC